MALKENVLCSEGSMLTLPTWNETVSALGMLLFLRGLLPCFPRVKHVRHNATALY